ncbi:MAG: type II secretion system F family protein [Gammaproteobacteria bacterium]|nr:type II secretion system F family protein [Gammaproteobacteria bacterium]
MTRFVYKAMDADGLRVQGEIEAANESDVELRVKQMGFDLIRAKPVSRSLLTFGKRKIGQRDIINFIYHQQQLINAKVPIVEALQDLRESIEHPYLKDVTTDLIEAIRSGKTFSEALSQHPDVFDVVMVNMVRVGEASGRLAEVMKEIHGMLEWQDELIAQSKRMLIYPLFVLIAVLCGILLIMTYLVPQLIPFMKMSGQVMPWHTLLLISVSKWTVKYWWLIFTIVGLAIALYPWCLKRYPAFRYKIDEWKLRAPILGNVLYKIKLARFCHYFALTYKSGINLIDAMRLIRPVLANVVLEEALLRAQEKIAEGKRLSDAFAHTGVFPNMVVRMLRIGESAGSLDESLDNVSHYYNREVQDAIGRVQPLLMPLITVLLASIILWVLLSMLSPIMDAVISISAM